MKQLPLQGKSVEQLSSKHNIKRSSISTFSRKFNHNPSNIILPSKGKKSPAGHLFDKYAGVHFESSQKFWDDSLFQMDGGEPSTDQRDQKDSIQIRDDMQQQ